MSAGMARNTKIKYKTATAQVVTGDCYLKAIHGIPSTTTGNIVVYSGTTATSGNEVGRVRTTTATNSGITTFKPDTPIFCSGGIYATVTSSAAVIVEIQG